MGSRVFVAGATGVIGRRLVLLLVGAGYETFGTTRSQDKRGSIEALGAEPVVVDALDAHALRREVARVAPEAVVHQLTDLPPGLDPARMAAALPRNARVRIEGTRNLVAAALAAKARRLIAQSIAWVYAPGPRPHREEDPLDAGASGERQVTIEGVIALEQATLGSPPLIGTVLRYGQLYGPGTGRDAPAGDAPLHVAAAAWGALLALQRQRGGIFNFAESDAYVSSDKARRELGWDPGMR
jgi:nucleoside-diphosphate-sugar epimerase